MLLHRLAILEHVRDTGRHAEVVFENDEATLAVADQVDAGDVDPDVLGRPDALEFRSVALRAFDEVARDDARVEDRLVSVDIGQEVIQRLDALFETGGDVLPLGCGDHARNQVEGEDFSCPFESE